MARGTGTKGGGGVNEQSINAEGQASVFAVTQSELEHESEENSEAYTWCSKKISVASGGGTVLLVKNTSDKPLHITTVALDNGALASEYVIHLPTTEVTPTGGAITGTNINTAGPQNVADASAKSDETNNTQGNVLRNPFLLADAEVVYKADGLILGKNKSIGVDVVENTSESSVTITGHYED